MDIVFNYMKRFGWITLLGVILAACASNAEDIATDADKQMLSIGFSVPTATSSTLESETEEAGTGYENYIDWTDYRIYFFDVDNKYLARFNPSNITSRNTGNATQYEAVGKIPQALLPLMQGTGTFKVVVLANWPNYPQDNDMIVDTTLIDHICNDVNNATFEAKPNTALGTDNRIPFYGVQEYTDIRFSPGQTTELEAPVYLLRAVAKVEVILDTSIPGTSGDQWEDLTFTSVTLHWYNRKGFCAPSGVYDRASYPDEQADEAHTLHLINNVNDSEAKDISLRPIKTTTEERWIAYLPEYNNSGTDYSYLEVKFNYQLDEDTDTYKIYFSSYSGEAPTRSNISLIRNNIYRFTVQKEGFKLLLNVSNWEGLYINNFEYGNGQFTTPPAPWEDEINNDIEIDVDIQENKEEA